jgi:hypothetical protein
MKNDHYFKIKSVCKIKYQKCVLGSLPETKIQNSKFKIQLKQMLLNVDHMVSSQYLSEYIDQSIPTAIGRIE